MINQPLQSQFLSALQNRVLLFDGAMGTSIHAFSLDLQKDYAGLENCSEILCQTRPDVIQQIHESFLAAGCDAVETNTFGSNKIVLAEFGIADRVFELNRLAVEIARRACNKHSTPDKPRFVIGSIGPGTRLPSLGHTTFDILVDSYLEQVRGLLAGGVDALLIETQQDLLTTKAALNAAMQAMAEAKVRLPVMVQVTIETTGSMLVGSDLSAVVAALEPYDCVVSLGLNCATGPAEMGEHVQYLAHHWPRLISVLPNAGLPIIVDGKAHYPLTPADFAHSLMRFVTEYGVNIVGGCCGTTYDHLRAVADRLRAHPAPTPRPQVAWEPVVSSLYASETIRQETSYLIIAERTNTNGSKKFRTLLEAQDFDGMVAMARDEMRDGSHVLDVCVDFVGRDGLRDIREVLSRFIQQIAAPIMIDSTSPEVMEAGLKLVGGRCIINSMNLEEGEEKIARIARLARRFGAAVVCGTIDEDKQAAMARTADRKLAIARRIYNLATSAYGLRPQDLLFDPLVLPISTGIEEDRRNALETIEGIRRITSELPGCGTVIGLSNISFGLKPAARVVLNSAFLNECREAGLTSAIAHVSKILPRTKIEDGKWNAALDLIYDRRREGFDPLTQFISLFKEESSGEVEMKPAAALPIDQRLQRHIIDGDKRDLELDLKLAMEQWTPLQIINDHLLAGMKVVGELFGSGQMQLPFVLQSAEVMKSAVALLQPFMEKTEGSSKGKLVLATVKGDVHDIGKNLVDIILSNNGYTVYNLGIKQPVAAIIHAAKEHSADAIGMSGLLVKSVAVMKENLEELNAQQLHIPVLLGGAALTRSYTDNDLAKQYAGPLFYCKDAFEGLHTMDRLMAGEAEQILVEKQAEIDRRTALRLRAEACQRPAENLPDHSTVDHSNPLPAPPFWGRRVVTGIPLKEIFPFINELALFRGQWGFKRGRLTEAQFEQLTEEKAHPVFKRLCQQAIEQELLTPRLVYGYFPCQSEGDDLIVYHPDHAEARREWLRFTFPRQSTRRRLCIADFIRPSSSGELDVLGVQAVTVGERISELTQSLFATNQYQDYLYWHGFGVECAEALAELWHKRIRAELGFAHDDRPTMREIFTQGYRGSRYSFGYGACPNLEDRAKVMELLRGEEIGLKLTENYMLEPEQSTDALILHHPQAKYFDV